MSLLLHRFLGAGSPGGPSGYYIRIDPEAQYYTGNFQGVRPAYDGGWYVNGYRGNGNRFIARLSSTGALTTYKIDSSNFNFNIRSNASWAQFASPDDRLVMEQNPGVYGAGFISRANLNYINTPVTHPVAAPIIAVDDANSRIYTYHSTGGGYQPTLVHINSRNLATSTNTWTKKYTIGGGWNYIGTGVIRAGDSTNVWIHISRDSRIGFVALNKTTGATTAAYELANDTMNNSAISFITDTSGNMYVGTYNGNIVRINADNTTAWAKSCNYAGQNFGYTYICFYNGYLYGVGTQHPNGNFLFKINPSDGTFVWFINMPNASNGFYGITGISAGPDGIGVVGNGASAGGYEKSWFLNYPLDAGLTGTYGDFTFASGSASASSISAPFTAVSGPSFSTGTAPVSGSYGTSLSTTASIFNTKVLIG